MTLDTPYGPLPRRRLAANGVWTREVSEDYFVVVASSRSKESGCASIANSDWISVRHFA